MLVLLSPAKSLDFVTPIDSSRATQPALLQQSEVLVKRARRMSAKQLRSLMSISESLAEENVERFKTWSRPFTDDNARPAVHAFIGDVYQGLNASTLGDDDLAWAQDHVRILSGLHGLLRPMDLIQP
ncbi:MAG: peroxide stress protein YaaA, partial [Acidobacteriota bacterium]